MPRATLVVTTGLLLTIAASVTVRVLATADETEQPRRIDPAAWGADHVGKSHPAYMTGDECLFCHRTIGPTWLDNRHPLTMRPASPDEPAIAWLRELIGRDDFAAETRYLMGSQRIIRFLRRSKEYGKLEILSASFVPKLEDRGEAKEASAHRNVGELKNSDSLEWEKWRRCAKPAWWRGM